MKLSVYLYFPSALKFIEKNSKVNEFVCYTSMPFVHENHAIFLNFDTDIDRTATSIFFLVKSVWTRVNPWEKASNGIFSQPHKDERSKPAKFSAVPSNIISTTPFQRPALKIIHIIFHSAILFKLYCLKWLNCSK